MVNKAVSKVVTRVALVFGLVLAANAVKPFSPSNLALHTLASARSFSFLLPIGAIKKIEHANYLAQTYSRGLFEGEKSNSILPRQIGFESGLLASNHSPQLFDDAEIKDVKSGEPARKQSSAKRATRRVRQDNRDNHNEVSNSDSNPTGTDRQMALLSEASAMDSPEMIRPVSLPVFKPTPAKAYLTPASVMFSLPALPAKLNSCKTIEVKEVKLIALIQQTQQSSKLKIDMLATQPAKISLQCREEQKAVTEEAEAVVETTSAGPQEEIFFEPLSVTAPFATIPLPECSRLP